MKIPYTDEDEMPFGKHAGEPLSSVPASYLHWLWTQRPLNDQRLESYLHASLDSLKMEFPDGIW